jgi:peroxiredoxin
MVLIGVNLDTDAKKMAPFLKDRPVTFPIVRDAAQQLVKAAKINAMPTTVIVGRDGVIREIHSGFSVKEGPAKLAQAIEAGLGKDGP